MSAATQPALRRRVHCVTCELDARGEIDAHAAMCLRKAIAGADRAVLTGRSPGGARVRGDRHHRTAQPSSSSGCCAERYPYAASRVAGSCRAPVAADHGDRSRADVLALVLQRLEGR